MNRARQEALGVETYIWRGARDRREHDCHLELERVGCSWDEPPMGGGTDETEPGHPGEEFLCRCYSEPVFRDVRR